LVCRGDEEYEDIITIIAHDSACLLSKGNGNAMENRVGRRNGINEIISLGADAT
jgi:hypothetical protein